jgi:hypothetical protein
MNGPAKYSRDYRCIRRILPAHYTDMGGSRNFCRRKSDRADHLCPILRTTENPIREQLSTRTIVDCVITAQYVRQFQKFPGTVPYYGADTSQAITPPRFGY